MDLGNAWLAWGFAFVWGVLLTVFLLRAWNRCERLEDVAAAHAGKFNNLLFDERLPSVKKDVSELRRDLEEFQGWRGRMNTELFDLKSAKPRVDVRFPEVDEKLDQVWGALKGFQRHLMAKDRVDGGLAETAVALGMVEEMNREKSDA